MHDYSYEPLSTSSILFPFVSSSVGWVGLFTENCMWHCDNLINVNKWCMVTQSQMDYMPTSLIMLFKSSNGHNLNNYFLSMVSIFIFVLSHNNKSLGWNLSIFVVLHRKKLSKNSGWEGILARSSTLPLKLNLSNPYLYLAYRQIKLKVFEPFLS